MSRAWRGGDTRKPAAKANFTEAYKIFVSTRGETDKSTLECAQALIDLYAVRNTAGPGERYSEKIAIWRARLK